MRQRVVTAYQYGKIKVMFTRKKLDSATHFGEQVLGTLWVYINPRRRGAHLVSVIDTLVHEAIHVLEPTWHHNKVYAVERDVRPSLTTWDQQHLLLWALDNGVWRDC